MRHLLGELRSFKNPTKHKEGVVSLFDVIKIAKYGSLLKLFLELPVFGTYILFEKQYFKEERRYYFSWFDYYSK